MKRSLVLVILAVCVMVIPQIVHAGWSRTYGEDQDDFGYSMDYTYDDCYIVLGRTESVGGGGVWLLKVDSTGDTLWTRTYEGSGVCVAETSDKGFIFIGGSRLLKTDSVGDSIWSREYNGLGEFGGSFVQETNDGSYVITGWTRHPDSNDTDFLLLKVDSLGDSLWSRVWGSEDDDWGNCVRESSDGGYVVTGCYYAFEGLWGAEVFWSKYDKDGTLIWRDLEGKSMDYAYEGLSIQLAQNGGYIISGNVTASILEECATLLIKVNAQGEMEWKKEYSQEYFGECVQSTIDNGYILTGYTWSLCKIDDKGGMLWKRNYGGFGRYLIVSPNGDYVMTGEKDDDLWLLKTDSLGDTLIGIEEQPPVPHQSDWNVVTSIGSQIVLRYTDSPHGFHADVFNATGRRVDELHASLPSGTISWGRGFGQGVYFIRDMSSASGTVHKVVLTK